MKRYLAIAAAMMLFFLALYLSVEALGISLLTDPTPWMKRGETLAACVGVTLLVVDVLLPVPSSLVMVAHGMLFGVVTGTLLSLLGSLGAALFGFAIGRRGGWLLERLVTPEERARADEMLVRWGALAVVITRPVPILAETVAIIAGTCSLGWGRMALASLLGSLPAALLYALTGAGYANFHSFVLVFVAVLLVAGGFWVIGRRLESSVDRRQAQSTM